MPFVTHNKWKPQAYNLPMKKSDFSLEGEYVELNQLLKLSGLCDSGGAGKLIVASGDVKVDGKTELRKTCKIRAGQVVTIGDVTIRVHAAAGV
jgi:ribosome-associated protein